MTRQFDSQVIRFCEQHLVVLQFLESMNEDDFNSVASELAQYPSKEVERNRLIEYLSNACRNIMDTLNAAQLVDSLMAMVMIAGLSRLTSDELSKSVSVALVELGEGNEGSDSAMDIHGLERRIARLLSAESVQALARGNDVFSEHDQTFNECRIITDVRPVYGEDPDEEPTGLVVVHNLRIQYFSDGNLRSFTVALRSKDLEELSAVVTRAEKKAASFGRLVQGLDLSTIAPTRSGGL